MVNRNYNGGWVRGRAFAMIRVKARCVEKSKPYLHLIVSGMVSGALYLSLYLYEREIMAAFTRTDGWFPVLPVLAAFVFSFAHGAFTGYFWDVLGIKARRKK
jgi:phosphate/sulfate permease